MLRRLSHRQMEKVDDSIRNPKIKHILKMASDITTECGNIQTVEELEQQRAIIPLQIINKEN